MRRILTISALSVALAGCLNVGPPRSAGEMHSGYTYVPIDPLPLVEKDAADCKAMHADGSLVDSLPDNAVRIAIRQLSGSGSLGFAPAAIGVQGEDYQVILDYINADVANETFDYTGGDIASGRAPFSLALIEPSAASANRNQTVVPVYVGIGLRLIANVSVRKGNVNLSSLGGLSAAAQAQKISGSLIVQTLGITGKQVTGALPLPSELNPTTIQNAIQALGAIKAIVDAKDTIVTPRVIGIYDPLPSSDQATINRIVSQLAKSPIAWNRNCPALPQ